MVALSAPQFPVAAMPSVGMKGPGTLQSLLAWPLPDSLSTSGVWPDAAATIQALAARAQMVQLAQFQEIQKMRILQAQQQLAFAGALHESAATHKMPEHAPGRSVCTPPPGLELQGSQQPESPLLPPPGLELSKPVAAEAADDGATAVDEKVAAADTAAFEGSETKKVVWHANRFTQQLAGAMGRPLVSPCLEAKGLSDMWIMVEPCIGNVRGKEQKERFRRRIKSGPLDCRIKVKLAEAQNIQSVLCRVTIGSHAFQAFSHNFAEEPLLVWQPTDFDWSKEVGSDDSVEIGIELAVV